MSEPRIHAPPLPANLEWFNTDGPIRLEDQRGKVVLLDFWTYCCINCMHVLPDLRYLEDKYADGLTVIGLHSPKFPNERVGAHLQKAINRYHIRHPVANDPTLSVWKQYAIKAWPSIIFIDPEGYVVGVLRGEGRRAQLDQLIRQHLEAAEAAGIRNYAHLASRPRPEPTTALRFPGRVLATDSRLYISDSGRNRVLETNHAGRVLRRFGSGSPGMLDGGGEEAGFDNPQGLALVDEYLYVADTGNHALRRIHRKSGDVETVAGTGQQARGAGASQADPTHTPLNSPWALAFLGGDLFIAMAGAHQLWKLDLRRNRLAAFVGSGREDLTDGGGTSAAFAQPSGLAASDGALFVADAESSAIRSVHVANEVVGTVVGMGLFEFGDRDGVGRAARLQHPLDIVYDRARNTLWIADSYNHKIRKVDLSTNAVSSVACNHPLQEPGGLSLNGNTLWIANTNAHEIVRLDIATDECRPLEITD